MRSKSSAVLAIHLLQYAGYLTIHLRRFASSSSAAREFCQPVGSTGIWSIAIRNFGILPVNALQGGNHRGASDRIHHEAGIRHSFEILQEGRPRNPVDDRVAVHSNSSKQRILREP